VLRLYNALITVLWPLLYLYRPFRGSIRQRLGDLAPGAYDPASSGLKVLVNAVSAGEVVAIAPALRELRRRRPDAQVALLTTTDSGRTMAQEKLGDVLALLAYFPLIDLPSAVRRYLDMLKPGIYVTTEAELWPNIQTQCRQRGIPVVLANARLYLHNKRGLRGAIVRRLYELCDLILCQDERQRGNFVAFGLPESKLRVCGNTKFDFALPDWDEEQLAAWRGQLGLGRGKVAVAGSTHQGEDEMLLSLLKRLRVEIPGVQLIIAPRHIERADEIRRLATGHGWQASLFSSLPPANAWDVLIVDQYGLLVDLYRVADVVVMGGTFHPRVGGHNILEATLLGKPVVVGPHRFSIVAQTELLAAAGGIVIADSEQALGAAVKGLLADPRRARRVGDAARLATLANQGAAGRVVDELLSVVATE